MNTKQLIPITGALIAGLIGVASAACYGFTTHLCHSPGEQVGDAIPCPDGGHPHYAMGYWWGRDAYQITNPEDYDLAVSGWYQQTVCHGPASYIDCNGYPHTIDDFQDQYTQQYTEPIDGYQMPCEL